MPLGRRLLGLLFLTIASGQSGIQAEGPRWLFHLNTPQGVALAIGHAPRYLDESRGYREARKSGYLKLAFQFVVHVEAKIADVVASDGLRSTTYSEISTDNSVLEWIEAASIALDSAVTQEGTYVLLAMGSDPGQGALDISRLKAQISYGGKREGGIDKPNWPNKFFANGRNAVGIGSGYRIIGENEYIATKDAWFNIAVSRSVRVQILDRSMIDGYLSYNETLSRSSADATISGARVIKRWYDHETGSYYVMVSTE